MLIEFTVENFRSIRDPIRLGLVASSAADLPGNRILRGELKSPGLRSLAIFGPNASGKSNLLMALGRLGTLVQSSLSSSLGGLPPCEPFLLGDGAVDRPTRMSMTFDLNKIVHVYEVLIARSIVLEERLTVYVGHRSRSWFHRIGDRVEVNRSFPAIEALASRRVNPGRLFLGLAASKGLSPLAEAARWLAVNLRSRIEFTAPASPEGDSEPWSTEATARRLKEDPKFLKWAGALLRETSLGLEGIDVEVQSRKVAVPREARDLIAKLKRGKGGTPLRRAAEPDVMIQTRHLPVFLHRAEGGRIVRFGVDQESHGTRRLFTMLSPFYDVFNNGELVIVDEFSAGLHPMIVRELVGLFHNPKINRHGAQLVFSTHDTNLLTGRVFRRDQVWFTEKDADGATRVYSLRDVKGVREDDALERGYLAGCYGAVPFLDPPQIPPTDRRRSSGLRKKKDSRKP